MELKNLHCIPQCEQFHAKVIHNPVQDPGNREQHFGPLRDSKNSCALRTPYTCWWEWVPHKYSSLVGRPSLGYGRAVFNSFFTLVISSFGLVLFFTHSATTVCKKCIIHRVWERDGIIWTQWFTIQGTLFCTIFCAVTSLHQEKWNVPISRRTYNLVVGSLLWKGVHMVRAPWGGRRRTWFFHFLVAPIIYFLYKIRRVWASVATLAPLAILKRKRVTLLSFQAFSIRQRCQALYLSGERILLEKDT